MKKSFPVDGRDFLRLKNIEAKEVSPVMGCEAQIILLVDKSYAVIY